MFKYRYIIPIFLLSVFIYICFYISKYINNSYNIVIKEKNGKREVVEIFYDFGLINDIKIREKIIEIKNTLNKPVQIYDIESSCGCSNLLIGDSVIKANSNKILRLTVNPKKREGENIQKVHFKLDKGNIKHVIIHVKSNIKLPFYYSPEFLQIESNSYHSVTAEIRVKMNYGETFIVSSISCPKGYTLSCKVGDKFAGESTILLTREPSEYETDNPKNIVINSVKGNSIKISVIENKPKYFLTYPEHLTFLMGTNEEITKYLHIKAIPDQNIPVDIHSVNLSTSIESVTVQVVDSKEKQYKDDLKNALTVKLTAHSDLVQSSTFGFVILESGHYQQSIPIWINKLH